MLSTCPAESQTPDLKTRLGKAFHKALKPQVGSETDTGVHELDELRCVIKVRITKVPDSLHSRYTTLEAQLQQKLLSKRAQLIRCIQSYENQHYLEHSTLPDPASNPEYNTLIYEKNFTSKLLQLTQVHL